MGWNSGRGRDRLPNEVGELLVRPLHSIEPGPVAITGLHGVPVAGLALEPPSFTRSGVGTVLGVACPVLGQDEPEAPAREEIEGFAIVGELAH